MLGKISWIDYMKNEDVLHAARRKGTAYIQ